MITNHSNVRLTGGFWKAKEDLNRDVTINSVYEQFYETGRITAFKCDWKEGEPKKPHVFWDSDVAKWIEGASYILERDSRPDLEEKIEWLIDQIEKNQWEDGYFNIYFTVQKDSHRFTERNHHELYCAGHLMEAAVAYFNATGRTRFLGLMEKYADCIAKIFVEEKSAAFVTPGHEEIEIALYRMYKTTGKKKFLDLCAFFLEKRGNPDNNEENICGRDCYAQNHLPIREQKEAFGHSVRAMYLYSAMADYADEIGDKVLFDACRALFEDCTAKKMYITGGIGSTHMGEAFTIPYDLPNKGAYTETCASIGMMFFANRMFRIDPAHPSKYADIIETEMYNGMLSGISLDGKRFFYENPLEIDLVERNRITGTYDHERFPITQRPLVFGCSCCPPNLNRVLASLGDYFYGYDEESGAVYVNQFGKSEFASGSVKVSVDTEYPHDGKIAISSNTTVLVRIPDWCRHFTADKAYVMVNGYAKFDAGEITIEFEMKPELVASSAMVVANIGKAALRRGPIVYCAEGIDNSDHREGGRDVHLLAIDRTAVADANVVWESDFGADVIDVRGFRIADRTHSLYTPLDEVYIPVDAIRMIPYHCFANRGETNMLVYMNYR